MASDQAPKKPSESPPTPAHEELLVRARRGDQGALVELLAVVGPTVRRRIAGKITAALRPSLDEDDVMQVTFLEACLGLDKFERGGVSEFAAWLSRMAENNLIDAVRALESGRRPDPRKRVQPASEGDSYAGLLAMLGATYSTPSVHAARGELKSTLDRVLAAIPPDYEKVIRLYDLAGRDASEVARELGRSEGAVYMLRARAHERLRLELGSSSQFFSTPG